MVVADNYSTPWPNVSLVWPRPRTWRLLRDYSVEWTAEGSPRQRLTVPAAFECDGASVPSVVEAYLGRELVLREALFHDWIYAHRGEVPAASHLYLDECSGEWRPTGFAWSRRDADRLFARLLESNTFVRGDHRRRNAYRMVRLFGWLAWRRKSPPPAVLAAEQEVA